jgi:formylglycine-generating enzyme required for sulfatase activity
MSPAPWFRVAAGLGCLLAASLLLDPPSATADVDQEEVDLTLADEDKEFTNSIGMKFVRIGKGKFMMGTANNNGSEKQHEVELTKDFYLGVYEVTQGQWKAVMGKDSNPSHFSKTGAGKDNVQGFTEKQLDEFPVEMVSWDDTQKLLVKLNALDNRKGSGRTYRLPTEAEWEYACRAGSAKLYTVGDVLTPKDANFSGSNSPHTVKVGSYPANKFGLFDVHGNVFEWCQDCYDANYYANSPKRDPLCLKGATRVERGGGYYNSAGDCRSATRYSLSPKQKFNNLGFRVALVAAR